MKPTIQTLTANEIRFILSLNATWSVLRDPVLTQIYQKQWAMLYPRPLSTDGKELTLYGYVFNVMWASFYPNCSLDATN